MSGLADPGGIDGQIYVAELRGSSLTVEPTHPVDTSVRMWAVVRGAEQRGIDLTPRALRELAADLSARADLIDPSTTTAAPTSETGA